MSRRTMPTITSDEWRSAYEAAVIATARKSDPSKGKTAKEWAEQFSKWDGIPVGEQGARSRIRAFEAAGRMIRDTDWRPFDNAMRRTTVYRFTSGKAAK